MNVTRIPKALMLPVLATLVLAACTGGQIGATEEPSAAASEAAPTEMAFPTGDVTIELWTKEGDPQIEFVQALADDFTAMHTNITFDVVNKDVELLREDMVNTALSPEAQPELLWTVSDHTGPLTAAGVIQSVDSLVDTSLFVEAALLGVQAEGETWGVPISLGNQLMLYWNKSIIGDEAPADTDELISVASDNTSAPDTYGLVFNETESFWLTPWIGGFGGEVFADDGVTPTLDTDAMQGALQFLYDLKYTEQVMPESCDYTCASDLFTTGAAAMIVNGDWELANYSDQLGEDLGVGPLPTVT
ncbi:MAG: extracellular solute-binding protein, partial [Candidatus Limnocylindria bacterium]